MKYCLPLIIALVVASLGLYSNQSLAIELGGTLPAYQVESKGELILEGEDIRYQPWSSSAITNDSPTLIFYMAARLSSEKIIAPLRDQLDAKNYADGSFQSISIVNMDEALWGTGGLVLGKLADNKRDHPRATIIADDVGSALSLWSLKKKSVAVILLNSDGVIEYLNQGSLSENEVAEIIQLLDKKIAKSQAK
ncbi:putative transcriptional regulator [Spongiibacter sp. IMCC21906]|uniref:YtfJ family protein n=1 Tax=Spongiibacter sp. IMCC21906 TaxID=1620392 RepID=UPI00062DE590|nr:YtfJ family protein [Spongiibacter sp. IMCC21906]AKH70019.1 putative transcriptional regulator [Spongiibacter sp. IMCC21906]